MHMPRVDAMKKALALPRKVRERLVVFAMMIGVCACGGPGSQSVSHDHEVGKATSRGSGWTIDVPEGLPILLHDPVPLDQRVDRRINLREDLVIGSGSDSGEAAFYNVLDIAVDRNGRIFVVDGRNDRVQVFDSDGDYVMTIGRFGRGPGEFIYPVSAGIAGDRLAVFDDGSYLLSLWTLDGEYLESHRFEHQMFAMDGTDSGFLVGRYGHENEQGHGVAVAQIPLDGGEPREYALLPEPRPPTISRSSGGGTTSFSVPAVSPSPWFAVARSGEVFVTAGDEYQVLAMSSSGEGLWAMHVAWPRLSLTDAEIEAVTSRFTSASFSEAEIAKVQWPTEQPALASGGLRRRNPSLAVDGHGHLYVFPYVPQGIGATDRPVDVYSLDGKRLFSGMLPDRSWVTARNGFVYGIEQDSETSEYVVVRYRLEEPF